MSNEIYDFIIFRGKDLKDLTVLQGAPERSSPFGAGSDPFLDSHSSSLYSHGGVPNDPFGFVPNVQPQAHLGYQPSSQVQAPPPMSTAAAPQRPSMGSAAAPRSSCVPAAPAAPAYPAAPRPSPPPAVIALSNPSRPAERPPMASAMPGGPSVVPGSTRPYAPSEPPPPPRPPGYEDVGLSAAPRGPVDEAKALAPRASEPKERPVEPKEQKARGRGKGGGQKKPLYEVLRFHKRAEEAIVKMMRSQGSSALQPGELRAMSEMNPSVYHFYLDFVNYCCPSHMVQSDEQQWEGVCKALQKHFEKEFGAHQSQKPQQPQRPNNTLGDFITIETNSKASKKNAKVTRGGGRVGRGTGRGAKKEADEPNAGDLDGPGGQDDGGSQPASWVCPRCTLRNEDLLLECVACGTSKQQAALWVEFPPLG